MSTFGVVYVDVPEISEGLGETGKIKGETV
jgi:hypothetical protein